MEIVTDYYYANTSHSFSNWSASSHYSHVYSEFMLSVSMITCLLCRVTTQWSVTAGEGEAVSDLQLGVGHQPQEGSLGYPAAAGAGLQLVTVLDELHDHQAVNLDNLQREDCVREDLEEEAGPTSILESFSVFLRELPRESDMVSYRYRTGLFVTSGESLQSLKTGSSRIISLWCPSTYHRNTVFHPK